MDVVTPLYQTLQAQANLDQARATAQDTQALAQLRLQNVMLGGIKQQQMLNTQSAMAEAFKGWNPDDPSFQPSPDDTAVDAARKNAARLDAQANFARKAAALVSARGGDPNFADKMMDDAAQAGWRAAQAKREALAEDKNLAAQMSSIAAGVDDTTSLNTAMTQLSKVAPRAAKALAAQLDTDPFDGTYIYGPKSAQVMRTVRDQGRTAEQQMNDAIKIQNQRDKEADAERKRLDSEALVRERDAQAALAREHAELYKAQREGTIPAKAGKAAVQQPLRPATNVQKDSARDAILATEDFKDAKFDGSLPAFAADVAERTNKIMREAKANNEDLSVDDAREQAINELKSYVTERKVGAKSILGIQYSEGETRKTYTRGGAGKAANETKATTPAAPSEEIQTGRGGKQYRFIGGPNGDRTKKENWELVGG